MLLCKTFFRLRAKGAENIPANGPAVVAANHSSYLDPIVLSVSIPRRIKWIVRKDVYDVWWLKWLFILAGTIRENGSVGKALHALEGEDVIGVFPEGGRSPDGRLGDGKKGIAVMALKSGATVLPCAVRGAFKAYPRSAVLPRPYPVEVCIGKALQFKKIAAPDEKEIDSALARIMSAIKSLMEE